MLRNTEERRKKKKKERREGGERGRQTGKKEGRKK